MKRFRVLLISLILIMIGAFVLNFTYAEDSTRQMKAQPQRTSTGTDLVYKLVAFIGNDPHQYFYTIYKIFDAADEGNIYNKAIYCLRGGVGFGADDRTDVSNTTVDYSTLGEMHLKAKDVILKYNQLYNLDNTNDPTKGIGRTETINGKSVNIYNAILWVLDEAYLPTSRKNAAGKVIYNEVEYKNELLSRAGIKTSEDRKKISTDDIEVIQQLAIWYFTNYDEQTKNPPVLTVSQANKYITRTLYKNNSNDLPNARLLDKLYQYFIYGAIDNAGSYKIDPTTQARTKEIEENKFKRGNDGSSAEIRTHVLPAPTGYHQELAMTEYYTVIGPIVIDGENTKTVDATNIILYDKQDNPIKKVYQLSDTDKYTVYEFYEDTQDENSQIKFNNEGKVTSITGNPSTQLKKGTKYYIRFYDIFNVDFENKYPNVEEGTVYDTVEMLKGDATHPSEQYNIDEVNIKISSSYTLSTATFLYKDANNQALVELNKEKISDEDSLKIEKKKYFDLSLRKFIYSINGDTSKGLNAREPVTIDTTPLISGGTNWKGEQEFTAKYTHIKEPVTVKTKDKVVYEIRVYNEGDIPGIATEVKDYLPSGLEMIPKSESTINAKYDWEVSENGVLTTKYLKKNNVVIPAFNKNLSTPDPAKIASSSDLGYTKATTGAGGLYYAKLQVECKVIAPPGASEKTLRNIAAITEDSNVEGKADRDSNEEGNEPNINSYNPPTDDNSTYQEDDDDYEPLKLEKGNFDLSLRKYITKVNDNANLGDQTRDLNNIVKDNLGVTEDTAEYKHRKDPIEVKTEDKVIYTIRIYNEGDLAGRATKIVDQLPAGLKFLRVVSGNYELDGTYDETTNKVNLKEKEGNTNLDAYNKETKELKYTTIEIECEVTELVGEKDKVLTNIAYISEEYNAVTKQTITNQVGLDRDSEPATYPEKTATELRTEEQIGYTGKENKTETELARNYYFEGQQDEDDFEKVVIKGKIFDLALRKYITKINDDADLGDQTRSLINNDPSTIATDKKTATYKHQKNPVEVKAGDTITYTFKVYNEGDIPGYVQSITDYLPKDLELDTTGLTEKESTDANLEVYESQDHNYIYTYNKSERSITITAGARTYPAVEGLNIVKNALFERIEAFNGTNLDTEAKSVELRLKVSTDKEYAEDQVLTNVATMNYGPIGSTQNDRDSSPTVFTKPTQSELPTYNSDAEKNLNLKEHHYQGQQDDDDFEKLVIKGKPFDLSLRKYISAVKHAGSNIDIGDRSPKIKDLSTLVNGTFQRGNKTEYTATYDHAKDPIVVKTGDIVEYTIRVYNEGDRSGYAAQISDYIPEGLAYISDYKTNVDNGWSLPNDLSTENVQKLVGENGFYKTESEASNFAISDFEGITSLKDVNLIKGKVKLTSSELDDELIPAFNRSKTEKEDGWQKAEKDTQSDPRGLYYKEIKVACLVIKENTYRGTITNVAAITSYKDKDGKTVADRDSGPEDVTNPYTTWQEDDDDYEPIELKCFDLALRKFITEIDTAGNVTEVTSRIPQVKLGENGEITYDHSKEPLYVGNNDTVTYTIRVFNEGTLAGYAEEIVDDIPDGLIFLPDNKTNKDYGWKMYQEITIATADSDDDELAEGIIKVGTEYYKETDDPTKADILVTDYLSSAREKSEGRNNLINPFDINKGVSAVAPLNPDYRDVKVAFKVIEAEDEPSRTIINHAQISKDSDDDIDSIPGTWRDEDDDQDIELIKLRYFDLSLLKWVTQTIVTVDGKTTTTETGFKPNTGKTETTGIRDNKAAEPIAKVVLDRKKLDKTSVKFVYKIRVTNEGKPEKGGIEGYAKEITDIIPDGLDFYEEDNKAFGWKKVGSNTVVTNALENKLLKPGESAEVTIVFRWRNNSKNLGLKTNIAEITKDYNIYDSKDIDSTPNNLLKPYEKEQEDDDDFALVVLSIKTGKGAEYTLLITSMVALLAGGLFLVKKYVL